MQLHSTSKRRISKFVAGLLAPALLLVGANLAPVQGEENGPGTSLYLPVVASSATEHAGHQHSEMGFAPVAPPDANTKPQGEVVNGEKIARSESHMQALAVRTADPRDMKVLVVCADGNETDYPAITSFLAQAGIPYTVVLAANQELTTSMLYNASKAFYQGVILCTGSLVFLNPANGQWESALSTAEWQILWDFEAMFGIRQVTSYTAPYGYPDAYGLNYSVDYVDTTSAPLSATLTAAGQTVFGDLNPTSPVVFKNAWVYLSTVISPAVTTPLLVSPEGYAIASITKYPDGRENLTVTAANAPFLVHSMSMSYGIFNWLTKGIFLGERHVNVGYQVDDLFSDTDLWNPANPTIFEDTGITYRLTGADIAADLAWRNNVLYTQYPLANKFKLEWAYNGEGTTTQYRGLGIFTPDTLTPAIVANKSQYNFVNHTYTHLNLDAPTAATIQTELNNNHRVATSMNLTTYFKDSMVQPDISGLTNPNFFTAAKNFGIKYVIADTSRAGWNNPSPNAGFYSAYQPSILIIPRRASNLFYPVSTPAEWVGIYNCFYSIPNGTCANRQFVFWDRDLTYSEILDKESDLLLSYMLKWDIDPVMFHIAQIRAYNGTNTVLNDLIERTMQKYHAVSKLPIRNLSQHEIGILMARRMAYNASGVIATITPCKNIAIRTVGAATIPVTGIAVGNTSNREVYNGQNISYVTLGAGKSVTYALPACTATASVLSMHNVPAVEPDFAPPIEELEPALDQ